jgi:hypothetical protein
MESKYRWRKGERKCPQCGAEAIIKGKAEYGGGWLCFDKKGGCKAKFTDNDAEITGQQVGRVANPDISDSYNTVLKIATKRALVAAVLITTGASCLFTQDVEDMAADHEPEPAPRQQAAPQQQRQAAAPRQQTRQAAAPAAASAPQQQQQGGQAGEFVDVIKDCRKAGSSPEGAARPWTRYEITTGSGDKYSTFSQTVYEAAEIARDEQAEVKLVWEDKGRGANITHIEKIHQGELIEQ